MRDLPDIVGEVAPLISKLLEEAYQSGFEAGREAGANELRETVTRALTYGLVGLGVAAKLSEQKQDAAVAPAEIEDEGEGRLPPGSVKPEILRLVRNRPGLSRDEIVASTGFKPNSVRGTLWSLSSQDKAIYAEKGRWFPVPPANNVEDYNLHDGPVNEGIPNFLANDDEENEKAADDDPGRDASTAFNELLGQGGEPRPGGGT